MRIDGIDYSEEQIRCAIASCKELKQAWEKSEPDDVDMDWDTLGCAYDYAKEALWSTPTHPLNVQVCPECGSPEVVWDASVYLPSGEPNLFDEGSCLACGTELRRTYERSDFIEENPDAWRAIAYLHGWEAQ